MTAADFAHKELRNEGHFEVRGRSVVFISEGRVMARWACRDATEARFQMKMFRAAPKYVAA